MTFSWRYFRRGGNYYHALMLIFLAGHDGLLQARGHFDLLVWFELREWCLRPTAYRPRGRRVADRAPQLAVTNSVGAYLSRPASG